MKTISVEFFKTLGSSNEIPDAELEKLVKFIRGIPDGIDRIKAYRNYVHQNLPGNFNVALMKSIEEVISTETNEDNPI